MAGPPLEPLRSALAIAGLCLAYVVTARLGFQLAVVAEQVTLVWAPSGLAVAAGVLLGVRVLPGVLIAAFIANVTAHVPVAAAASIGAGNTLEAFVACTLLRNAAFRPGIDRLRDALLLIVASVTSSAVAATLGSTSLCASGLQPWGAFGVLFRDWWLGDTMGVLIVAPVLLTWASNRRIEWTRVRGVEAALLVLSTAAVCATAFGERAAQVAGIYPLHYLVFPVVVWGALRFGSRGAASAVFAAACVAVLCTNFGYGPFAIQASGMRFLLLQLFVAVMAVTGLLLGAAIEERDATHADLELSDARFRLALEAAHIGRWDWDVAGGGVRWSRNPSGDDDADRDSSSTFESFERMVHPGDRDRVKQTIEHALADRSAYETEFRTEGDTGTRWILARGRVLRDQKGSPTRMIGVLMDVTERREAEEQHRRRAEELSQHDRKKDEFLATLAHELRNPLAPIASGVEILMARAASPDDVLRLCGMMGRQVQNLVRLVDDLLDVSRIASGKVQLRKELVDLGAVLENAIEISRPALTMHEQQLEISLPDVPIRLHADPTRLSQVVCNLLNNSAVHGKQGGRVWLSLERSGSEACIRVRDDGDGMSPDVLGHAFELFAQGPATGRSSGLGIGLTLVRHMAVLHGGEVTAHSDGLGRGSEFIVRLPLDASDLLDRKPEVRKGRGGRGDARRILVVDDNEDAAETLAELLKMRGHHVSVKHDGESALEHIRDSVPDVVLLDVEMPGMNGYEVARALRGDPRCETLRIIAVSGYGQERDRVLSREAGIDLHMVKPVDAEALYAALDRPA